MKTTTLFLAALLAGLTIARSQTNGAGECTGGWAKYADNPVLGGKLGTLHDVFVLKNEDGRGYLMYSSWLDGFGVGLSESSDGLEWTQPVICLNDSGPDRAEDHVNRPVVLKKDEKWYMWYSDQRPFRSDISLATSADGRTWKKRGQPVMVPTQPWEQRSVMCSHVIWDTQEKIFKMWYSAGDKFDPDAIGYATSKDGLGWEKHPGNPIFTPDRANEWEKAQVASCQVIKRENDYLMFYIGYSDPDHAQIGMARSKDGVSGWERYPGNPVIKPGPGSTWDSYAVYKPFAVADPENNRWLLYYNGRCGWKEQIGAAIHEGMDLGF